MSLMLGFLARAKLHKAFYKTLSLLNPKLKNNTSPAHAFIWLCLAMNEKSAANIRPTTQVADNLESQ